MWKKFRSLWQQPKQYDPDELLRLRSKYKTVFSTPEGEEVLFDICKHGYVFTSSFEPLDSHKTAFREGARWQALAILSAVDCDIGELRKRNETTIES